MPAGYNHYMCWNLIFGLIPPSFDSSMPPLTSPPGCGRCFHLSQIIAELEECISTLHQIRDDERFLESLVTVGTAPAHSAGAELDSTIPAAQSHAEDLWLQQGAKPKRLAKATFSPNQKIRNSTLNQEPWSIVSGISKGNKSCALSSL